MAMQMDVSHWPVISVVLDSIDGDDDYYELRRGREACNQRLVESIDRIGLTTPMVLQSIEEGSQRIVCGFARFSALRRLGAPTAAARIAPADCGESDLLLLAIADNVSSRGLNKVEEALAFQKARRHFSDEVASETVLPMLGQKSSQRAFARLERLAALPDELSSAVARGDVPEKAAVLLDAFSTEEQNLAARVMSALQLSSGSCRDFAKLAVEICGRDKTGLSALLENIGCAPDRIFCNEPRDSMRHEILSALRARRNPVLTDLQKNLTEALAKLNLPRNARLAPPQDFEGDRYRLTIETQNADGLVQTINTLRERLAENPEALRRIFEPRIES